LSILSQFTIPRSTRCRRFVEPLFEGEIELSAGGIAYPISDAGDWERILSEQFSSELQLHMQTKDSIAHIERTSKAIPKTSHSSENKRGSIALRQFPFAFAHFGQHDSHPVIRMNHEKVSSFKTRQPRRLKKCLYIHKS
jgi:hypothetical protein